MQHLLLLHGAIGSSAQLKELQSKLSGSFTVHLFDFPGHGGKPLPNNFSIAEFADSVAAFLQQEQLSAVDVFGYSMGGYVALYLAKHHPALVNNIATLATKFEWNEAIAAKEVKMLQADVIEQKLPSFAETLQQRHAPQDWKKVLHKTAEMLLQMGKDNPLKLDYHNIQHQTLIMLGDKDKMVSLEETEAVSKALSNAEFKLLTDTPHPIEQVNTTILAELLTSFFKRS